MARGFDSKAVQDQQDEAVRRAEGRASAPRVVDPRRKTLELAATDLRHRLADAEAAGNERLAAVLRPALAHVDAALKEPARAPGDRPRG